MAEQGRNTRFGLSLATIVERDGLVIAVKGTAKIVGGRTCHARHADVSSQFHRLAAKAVPRVVVLQVFAEILPLACVVDDESTVAVGGEDG